MSAYDQQDDTDARQHFSTKEEREHAKYLKHLDQSTCSTYRCCKCCAGSCCDPGSCCTIKCKCCRCMCCDQAEEELDMNRRAANYLLVESSMWHYDNFFEYAELVGQFSYITMFTIVFPLGALMALLRNLFEAQWDASRMWRDFKRPVPSRPSSTRPLGGWDKMIETQMPISCIFTSAFFVFCTGQLEAWVDLFNSYGAGSAEATGTANGSASMTPEVDGVHRSTLAESAKRWGNCQPASMNASVWWSFGKLDDSQSHCPVETRCGIESGGDLEYDKKQMFVSYMAPNYNCWELTDDRVPEERLVCEWNEHDFESLEMGMGFHQLAVRLLVWLILNHIQIIISRVVFSCLPAKTKGQHRRERVKEVQQRELIASRLFHGSESSS